MADRITQEVVETAYTGTPTVRVTQKPVEALYTSTPILRTTQRVVEVLFSPGVGAGAAGPSMQVVWID